MGLSLEGRGLRLDDVCYTDDWSLPVVQSVHSASKFFHYMGCAAHTSKQSLPASEIRCVSPFFQFHCITTVSVFKRWAGWAWALFGRETWGPWWRRRGVYTILLHIGTMHITRNISKLIIAHDECPKADRWKCREAVVMKHEWWWIAARVMRGIKK